MFENQLEKTGENYYFLKTIINNKVELMKLDLIESIGKLLSLLTIGLILTLFSSLTLIAAFVAFSLFLNEVLQSSYLGLIITASIIMMIGFVIYRLRQKLIYNPLKEIIYKNLYEDNHA